MAEEIQNTDQKSSYRSIFKATSLFGGVQVYQILIEVIKSKFIAVLLGPLGVGIQGLYTSGIQMIQQLTSLGLSQSAVRNVAEANSCGDNHVVSRTVTALKRLVWYTGLLGMLAVIVFSPLLSKSSFGDSLHIWGFIAISVTLLLTQISNGQKVILQGTHRYKYLAKCTAFGVTIGLLVSLPLYYLWGTKAIVPNIIISSITALLLSWFFSKKVAVEKAPLTTKETFQIGRTMLVMGIAMCLTQFLSSVNAYVLRSCIRAWGSVEEVGLYTAGYLLMTQYTGLVFQAMGTDFYPRLAAVNKDNAKCREVMNQQGEIGMLLLGPLMALCVVFIPIVVRILYSEEFLAVNGYVVWCAVGVMFQMASWAVSYIFIAKAESKLYVINEVVVGIYGLGLNLLGYYLGGLSGLGISFSVKYFLYMLQVYCIARFRYKFSFTDSFIKPFVIQLVLVILCLVVALLTDGWVKYVIGGCLILASGVYALVGLEKRTGTVTFIKDKIQKNR